MEKVAPMEAVDPAFLLKVMQKCSGYKASADVEKNKLQELQGSYVGDMLTEAVQAAKLEIVRLAANAVPAPPPKPQTIEQK